MSIKIDHPYTEAELEDECRIRNIKSKSECARILINERRMDLGRMRAEIDRVAAEMGELTGEPTQVNPAPLDGEPTE